jgi:1-deoxy-D-xylulose-5-phosphate synthase
MRTIVDIYSTFLQRSFDQIFQEVALQDLPVTFCLDRAGLCGADGPTHHGVFDNTYMRTFPNIVVMAPGDESDVAPMLEWALAYDGPASIRYPKANAELVKRAASPIELGRAEVYRWGTEGTFIAFGSLFPRCIAAAEALADDGLDVGVINARFLLPLDTSVILRAIEETGFVITIEESTVNGGFGSAVLEAANHARLPTERIMRLGIPDRFIEHGGRDELLADLGLDTAGLIAAAKSMAETPSMVNQRKCLVTAKS